MTKQGRTIKILCAFAAATCTASLHLATAGLSSSATGEATAFVDR